MPYIRSYTHALLLQAANYLNIKGLLDLTCQTVANMIKGQCFAAASMRSPQHRIQPVHVNAFCMQC